MRDYIIMTDSCCDLTDHMAKELELNVVPLTVHMDGKDYANLLDGSEISFEDFYKNIRAGILGTTSAANVGQFEDAMRAVLAQGKDIVSINFSSALSAVAEARSALRIGMTPDVVLTDCEAALEALGELNGKRIREDLVDTIFSRFCVGK